MFGASLPHVIVLFAPGTAFPHAGGLPTVKAAGLTTSLDTNDDPDDKRDKDVLGVPKYVDFFFPNEREARKLTRNYDLTQPMKTLAG